MSAKTKISLQFTLGHLRKTLHAVLPITSVDLVTALKALFQIPSVGLIEVDGESYVITDNMITDVLLPNADKLFKLPPSSPLSASPYDPFTSYRGPPTDFDPSDTYRRLTNYWSLPSTFGVEGDALQLFLMEMVIDRYALMNGCQILRDELRLASVSPTEVTACGIDWSIPTVITTCAYTNCGDRIQREATPLYQKVVGSRFATVAENGDAKIEMFSPAGGGTDNGLTLAHVTVAHMMDEVIKKKLYEGNPKSYYAVNIDLMSHVGRLDGPTCATFGRTKESPWRVDRNACGAVIGCLISYDAQNTVHRRIRSNLGEQNYNFLSKNHVILADGTNITHVIAAAIVSIQGMLDTAQACAQSELDERGLGHLTATLTVNRVTVVDRVIYLGRCTIFQKEITFAGFGTDATKYSGRMSKSGDSCLVLTYENKEGNQFKPVKIPVAASPDRTGSVSSNGALIPLQPAGFANVATFSRL